MSDWYIYACPNCHVLSGGVKGLGPAIPTLSHQREDGIVVEEMLCGACNAISLLDDWDRYRP